jgi:hypothetical protein
MVRLFALINDDDDDGPTAPPPIADVRTHTLLRALNMINLLVGLSLK